ncbi:MAG: hypothetical protein KDE19_11575 [Caldilineaceae bacterium]|nr:hypothetical protein [Caldilineaceae bacterium]
MSSKNMSPIVQANATTLKLIHPGYQRRATHGHNDVVITLMLCFLAYGFLVYFCMPTVAPGQYARVTAELGYYWQNALDSLEYRYYTAYLPYCKSLLQEGMAFIGF